MDKPKPDTTAMKEGQQIPLANTWNTIPTHKKQIGKASFVIPLDIEKQLLPSPKISLKALTDFSMPSQSKSSNQKSLTHFFSKEVPSPTSAAVTIRLRRLPTPDPCTVRQLVEFSRQAWLDGFTSVHYSHLQSASETTTLFPLWVISYWNKVLDIKKISNKWLKSRDWITKQLRQNKSTECRLLAEETSIMLTVLPWGEKKPDGVSEGGDPIHVLSCYLGPNWLANAEQDEMLELMRVKLLEDPKAYARFRLQNTYFTEKLLNEFDSKANYQTNKSSAWLRHLGDEVVQGNAVLVTVVHLGKINDTPHWVPLVVEKGEIRYGDSFGTGIPERLQSAFIWWLRQHHIFDPSIQQLPVTTQTDGHSCGILADNALCHFVNPISSPLLGNAESDVIKYRLRTFNLVAESILARVSDKINI